MAYQQTVVTKVAGTTFRSITPEIWDTINRSQLTLRREPTNEYDKNAIMVLVGPHHYHLGYIKAELAADLAGMMDDNIPVKITEHYVTGLDDPKKHNGVNLKLLVDYSSQMDEILKKHYKPLEDDVAF